MTAKATNKAPIVSSDREQRLSWSIVSIFGLGLLILSLLLDQELSLGQGLLHIMTSTCALTTDAVALGGMASATLNALLVFIVCLLCIALSKNKLQDDMYAALLITTGFAFFGITILNSLPIICGGFLQGKREGQAASSSCFKAILATALAPFVSYVAFSPDIRLAPALRYPLAFLLGLLLGMISVRVAGHTGLFHQGYTLYNSGFADGLVALIFVAIGRFMGLTLESKPASNQSNADALGYYILFFNIALLIFCLTHNRGFANYADLIRHPGKGGRYSDDFGLVTSLTNMALVGIIGFSYIKISGGPINGPVLAAWFAYIGFAAMGKHPLNTVPILLGVSLANLIGPGQANTTSALTAAMLGTALAPISGEFGPLVGLVAGILHASTVGNVLASQAGMNLYNNGFSTGLVAAFLYPLCEAWQNTKNDRALS